MAITVDKQGLKKFVEKWTGRGKEDEDDRSYWIDLFQNVFAQSDVTDRIDFQKKVVGYDGNTKRIDAYIPETNIIIEQKSLGIALDKPQAGHGGMTPYEQAKMYDNGLPRSEKARWIVISNFEEIWVFDMEKRRPEADVIKISLNNLDKEYPMLQFLFNPQVEQIRRELKVSQEAGDRIGKVYDALLSLYPGEPSEEDYKSLNLFCVRLVFCYYAEDAGLFGKYQFRDYVASFNSKHLRNGLKDLFRILDTKEVERDRTEEPDLLAFPYVNGGLFKDRDIIIPQIDEKTQSLITETSDFNWSEISPTIFGAVFESTLNQETRKTGGMHYTSIENIHKVIDPLFLDDLREEYRLINDSKQPNIKRQKLQDYQNKLGSLVFFDPACGSGNFLTETYLSLRKIENEVIKSITELDKKINPNQILLGEFGTANSLIKVNLSQFFGLEINDFAVSVARTALWIAESQMLKETEAIIYQNIDYLPLKSYVNIVKGNALKTDWREIVDPLKCSYIIGNPPFVGKKEQTKEQKKELVDLFSGKKTKVGNLDYVSAWFFKASTLIYQYPHIKAAFVSTDSLCQGEHVPNLWHILIEDYNIQIIFAHRTFKWDNATAEKAEVYCVIVGFASINYVNKSFAIYEKDDKRVVSRISPYLIDAPDVWLHSRPSQISDESKMFYGSMPIDNGALIVDENVYEEIKRKEPSILKYIRPYAGAEELLKGKIRYCIWLKDASRKEIIDSPFLRKRVSECKAFRQNSNRGATNKLADTPELFGEIRQPDGKMIVVPKVSSKHRSHIPILYVDSNEYIINGSSLIIPSDDLYLFGILSSNVHNAWLRAIAETWGHSFQYSTDIYNNFPFPVSSPEDRLNITKTAEEILRIRACHPDLTIADMYNPKIGIISDLLRAHQTNDKAVMKAYGFRTSMEESEIVAELMKMYQKLTEEK